MISDPHKLQSLTEVPCNAKRIYNHFRHRKLPQQGFTYDGRSVLATKTPEPSQSIVKIKQKYQELYNKTKTIIKKKHTWNFKM